MKKNKKFVIIIVGILLVLGLLLIIITNHNKEKEVDVNKTEMKVKPDGKPDENFIHNLKNVNKDILTINKIKD